MESEIHFLTSCQVYNDLRERYIKKHFFNVQTLSVNQLLNNDNPAIIRDVATFAYYAFTRRSDRLREIKLWKRIQGNGVSVNK